MHPNVNQVSFAIIAITIVFVILAIIISLIVLLHKRKVKTLEIEKKTRELAYQQAIIQTQIEIQEKTLETISQEIHDNIGQVLSLIKLNLSRMDVKDEASTQKLNTSQTLLNKVIVDLKDISNSLNTDAIEKNGLVKAVTYEVEIINKSGINTQLLVSGDVEKLNPKTELILFRMVQESLNNAIKHSQAKSIHITINYASNYFEIIIKDDGVGFDVEKINSKGLGLKNMQNRIQFINATLDIKSSFNGTEVIITIPKNK